MTVERNDGKNGKDAPACTPWGLEIFNKSKPWLLALRNNTSWCFGFRDYKEYG